MSLLMRYMLKLIIKQTSVETVMSVLHTSMIYTRSHMSVKRTDVITSRVNRVTSAVLISVSQSLPGSGMRVCVSVEWGLCFIVL